LEKLLTDRQKDVEFTVITQNVDGLHQRAGSTTVHELHGTLARHVCIMKGHLQPEVPKDQQEEYYNGKAPTCATPGCNSHLRPDAVLFFEELPKKPLQATQKAVEDLQEGDMMIVVGTSGVVFPAAGFPQRIAQEGKVSIVEINPDPSKLTPEVEQSPKGIYLQRQSGQALQAILTSVRIKHNKE